MPQKTWKNDLVRFHIEFGPASLFERVQFKMKDVHGLQIGGPHYNARKSERNIPNEVLDRINHFDTSEWKLITAEVRADRGKFYNSTWEYRYNDAAYWLTIGIGDCVITIVKKDSSGIERCLRNGELYDFVEKVNRDLMDNEKNIIV